uniref:Orf307 n=1 Tax=Schizosaccharomyces japonicus (strain yFS275 / FY16936) TaxID=402676 RepID=Q8HMZ4_SCHJY|nr:orf307 [Schizosaccharomyces japonicus]AAN37915.1 orf307 [Schizosaccharomyces japonicus]
MKNMKLQINSLNNQIRLLRTCNFVQHELIIRSEMKRLGFKPAKLPKLILPKNDIEFGHYLAGLIDGDGHFSSRFSICFNIADSHLAYYLQRRLGFGYVYKVKDKNAVNFTVSDRLGIEIVISLINGKFRTESKFKQLTRLLEAPKFNRFSKTIKLSLNKGTSPKDFDNYWLAGFSDADASFQIKLVKRSASRTEVRLNYQVDQKTDYLLCMIKNLFGGYVGHRGSQNTAYYGSTSYTSADKVVKYFDHYHMLSTKFINYLQWRKVYTLIKTHQHLTPKGLKRIQKIKSIMNSQNKYYCLLMDSINDL